TENREYPWGDDGPNCQIAVFFAGAAFCEEGPQPVDSRQLGATPDGVLHMAGNVAEWVADHYGPYPADAGPRVNPTGPEQGTLRVVRGGGHIEGGRWLRSKARWGAAPERRSSNIGFRCAWSEDVEDSVIRGALELPADEERQASASPYVDPAPAPLLLAEDLLFPQDLAVGDDDSLLVLDTGNDAIRRLSMDDYQLETVVEDVEGLRDLSARDGVAYVTTDSGELFRLEPSGAMLESLSQNESEPDRLKTFADGVFWFSDGRIRRYVPTTDVLETIVEDVAGLVDFTVVDGTVFYTTDGDGQAGETYLASIPVEGGEPNRIIDESTFEGGDTLRFFYFAHVHPLDGADKLRLFLRYRSFPNNSFVCDLDFAAGSFSCPGYAPPTLGQPLVSRGDSMLVPIRNSLLRYDDGLEEPFEHLAPFTRPGGYVIGDDYVVWTDQQNGKVYMQQY
ncbi:MAG: SUMF1/EgtB/PvdO family nonheme iron enzyme, partial [Myxococcota bacterium]